MRQDQGAENARSFLVGGGEFGRRLYEHDWSGHALAEPEFWPESLRTSLGLCLESPFPAAISWSSDAFFFCNDAWVREVAGGATVPIAARASELAAGLWDVLGPGFREAMASGRASSRPRVRLARPGSRGRRRELELASVPIREPDGTVAGVFHTAIAASAGTGAKSRPAHERSGAGAAAPERGERAGTGLARTDDSFLSIDRGWRILQANRIALEKSGRPAAAVLGASVWDVFPLWRGQEIESACRRAMAGEAVHLEFRGPHTGRWFDLSVHPTPDGLTMYARDVTDRVAVEEELRRSEAQLRLVTDALPVLISYVDAEERYRFNNRAYETWFGRPAEELAGRTLREVLGEEAYQEIVPSVHRALAGETLSYEGLVSYREAGPRNVESTYVPDRAPSGEVVGFYAMVLDVTARKRADQALRESEERFRTLFDSMDEGFCTIEVLFDTAGRPVDYRFLEVNAAFERQTGLRDARGKRMRELVPGHERLWFDVYGSIATTGASMRFESRAEGLQRWYEVHAFRIGPPEARQVAVLFNDVSSRRIARIRSEFLVHLDDLVRPLEEPGLITAAAARLLGTHLGADRCAYADVDLDEETIHLTGNWTNGVGSIVGRYRFAAFGEDCLRQMRAGEVFVVEDSETDPRTAHVKESYRATAIRSLVSAPLLKAGRLVAAMAVHKSSPRAWSVDEIELVEHVAARCWESIERARALRAVRESESRLRGLFEQSIAGIAEVDLTGRFLHANQRYCEIVGRSLEELLGLRMQDLTHPDDLARNLELFGPLAAGHGEPFVVEKRYVRPDGSSVWVSNSVSVVRDDHGAPLRCVAVSIDVTEAKRREQERRELLDSERAARIEAQHATRLKDEFVATLSHELRTPVNAMLGWAQLGRHGALEEQDVAQAFEVIERNARVQAQLISDLLDVSRIVMGKLRLDARLHDPREVVREAIAAIEPSARAKGQILDHDLDPESGPVHGDPARLQQVVWNLLSNAIKFTPSGGRIVVRLARDGEEVLITVADDGRGIEPEFLPHLFERFRQADSSTTRSAGGLGLGLAIAKKLVELHGGRIEVRSAGVGLGSTFTVRLPRADTATASHPALETSERAGGCGRMSLDGIRVLVVDDEPDARDLVRRLLADRRAEVVAVGSASEALQQLSSWTPALLVSDVGMPEDDGYMLMRRVRELPAGEGRDVPAIALTAFARPEDRARALLAGFQAHVTKPVDAEELFATIASLLGRAVR